MVDGETYGCVKSFCYLGDTLYLDGGADFPDTAKIRNGWISSSIFFHVKSSMTYGSETRPLLVDVSVLIFHKTLLFIFVIIH